jgi:hypothetical protein
MDIDFDLLGSLFVTKTHQAFEILIGKGFSSKNKLPRTKLILLFVRKRIITRTKMRTLVSPMRYLPSDTRIMGNWVGHWHSDTRSRTWNHADEF